MQPLAHIIADLVGLVKDSDSAIHGCCNVTSLPTRRRQLPLHSWRRSIYAHLAPSQTPLAATRQAQGCPEWSWRMPPTLRPWFPRWHDHPTGRYRLGSIPHGRMRNVDRPCPSVVHFATRGRLGTL